MKKATIFTFILLAIPFLSLAQVVEKTAEETGKAVPGEKISALDFVMKGGVFIIPIIILLFYTLYVVVERYRYIRRMSVYNPNLLNDIRMNLEKGNIQDALNHVQRDQTAYGSVVAEGIQTIGRPVSEIESNMEKVANIEIAKMEKGMGILGLVAGIAPTFGFIGTIAGVIKIFYNISISENVSIGNISGGLYEKMISSGAGLIVGIIAYSSYHILNAMIDNYALKIQSTNLGFITIIQRPGKWQ
ncbi:MotA/TolQ/ExbB proton channel family protein [Fluviicola sp.]|jgi:biopolymer transport protein ExbB|uniref:MotA/TolQ/ExbB proton channel family protein n=1 Tax=Fluviicola sp. TaxID=1917219 RepID=UPI00282FBD09|nr:MotA/TolQ/ExbB proton channel family protein [Fluviicola sp.]MDR0802422.1 MotA/TolQ/ExbB proton channel family protein [Fluviicola sp.]